MANVVKTIIQLRRAHTNDWIQHKDVVPAPGEPCFDLDLGTLKIGNGSDTYENLKAIGGVDIKISADGQSVVLKDGVFKLAGFEGAEVGAQPRVAADGTLEWIVPSTETLEGLQTTVAGLQSDVKNVQSDIKDIKEILTPSAEGAETLLSRVDGLEGKVEVLNGNATVEGSILKTVKDEINAFANQITDDGTVNTIKELFNYVANHGGEVDTLVADITTLQDLVGTEPVREQIKTAVSGKVDKVEGMGLSSNDFTDSLLNKLQAIEENAQVNTIENISVDGTVLDAVGKTINIPVADVDRAGVVKSSTGANKVNVANDGTMSVKKISIRSVFVPVGEELILDGGGADKDSLVPAVRVGNMGCDNIADAVACAENGDVIALQKDVNMGSGDNDHLVIDAENVTIDLGGKTLTANGSNGAVKVEGGMTTLDGTGTVSGTLGSDGYSMAVWCDNGTLVINDGVYNNMTDGSTRGTDLIYASSNGVIEINGGIFEAAKPEWTLNVKDADYKAGTAKIIVKGGKFKGFDPANNKAEGEHTNFVAEGYKSVLDGEYYIVKPI